jgi:biotin carboxyl carrier protein
MTVTSLGDGMYRVEHDGRAHLVYVAGPKDNRWAFWNGRVFRSNGEVQRRTRVEVAHSLTAPMPATVLKVLARPGSIVKKGETVIILEAMKMELPLRATADGTVKSVRCREGELVQPEAVLVDCD